MAAARLPAMGVSVWFSKGSTAQLAFVSSAGAVPRSMVEQADSRPTRAIPVSTRRRETKVVRCVMERLLEVFGSVVKAVGQQQLAGIAHRSEERRVGKECRSRWSPYH